VVTGSWTFGWEALVAIATGALAFVTYLLARSTRRLAGSAEREVKSFGEELSMSRQTLAAIREQTEAAKQEVDISRVASQATIRPVLVELPRALNPREVTGATAQQFHHVSWEGAPKHKNVPIAESMVWATADAIYCTVPLRNVGPGAAFIRGVGLRWQGRVMSAGGVPSIGVVPTGEVVRIQYTIDTSQSPDLPTLDEIEASGSFSMQVAYTDVAGEQWTLTRADVQRDARYNRWITSQVFIYHRRGGHNNAIDWGNEDTDFVAASTGGWGL
jgi:hypothetical protein